MLGKRLTDYNIKHPHLSHSERSFKITKELLVYLARTNQHARISIEYNKGTDTVKEEEK